MLTNVRKISMEQWFIVVAFILSLVLSFLFGYVVFRYWQVEVCKSPVQIVDLDL